MRDLLLRPTPPCAKREGRARRRRAERVAAFVDRYWAAVRLGLAFHRELPKLEGKPGKRQKQRPGHNLLIRLKKFKTETLRFLADFDVPFTNNLAERGLRMMEVRMKISGSFRTLEGAQIFARLRSVVSTARKRVSTSCRFSRRPRRRSCSPSPPSRAARPPPPLPAQSRQSASRAPAHAVRPDGGDGLGVPKVVPPNFFAAVAFFWLHSSRHRAPFRRLAPQDLERVVSFALREGGKRVHGDPESENLKLARVSVDGKEMSVFFRATLGALPSPE